MTDLPPALQRLLTVDPQDGGCGLAMELLDVYADLVAAGHDAAATYPAVAAHIEACGPCEEDLQGLLHALASDAAPPSPADT